MDNISCSEKVKDIQRMDQEALKKGIPSLLCDPITKSHHRGHQLGEPSPAPLRMPRVPQFSAQLQRAITYAPRLVSLY